MELVKALPIGAVMTFVVALVVGSQGSSGGVLAIHTMDVGDFEVFWSWPMFLASTGLAFGIFTMMK